ncbi:MAG: DUF72 domain-containing protein [Spirochaetaceae bacterium]
MGRILIGTSGYSYTDWVGPYYPSGTPRAEYLSFYARDFEITELNFSYYRMPAGATLTRLVGKTPAGFRFVIKAHRSLTHEPTASWRDDARRFTEAVRALAEPGRLAGILVQFPYSFHYTPTHRRYLDALSSELSAASAPLFIEYRNAEWQRRSVTEEMRRRSLALVITDMPRLRGLPAADPAVTSDRAYLRFHGRNAEAWWDGDNRSRYDYLYTDEELAAWVGPIRSVADRVSELIVMFNNHANAQAVINAKSLARLLS